MKKEEFKQIRTSLGLSQRKLAKILERNYRTIQRLESGEWKISPEIERLIKSLRVEDYDRDNKPRQDTTGSKPGTGDIEG